MREGSGTGIGSLLSPSLLPLLIPHENEQMMLARRHRLQVWTGVGISHWKESQEGNKGKRHASDASSEVEKRGGDEGKSASASFNFQLENDSGNTFKKRERLMNQRLGHAMERADDGC